MSGPQFANIQTYSLKENKAGNSIQQIIAEATRDEEYSLHVDAPQPPRILLGDPSTFADDHAAHVADRRTVVTMRDGSERRKAIRKDRHTMASIVVSYPVPYSAINDDEAREKLKRWEDRNIAWLRAKYGNQLKVVIAHDDEDHPHIHAWILPDNDDADAKMLHPGKAAKLRVEEAAKADGIELRTAVKMGNKAYRSVMKTWQDEYHAAVGVPEGLTRTGPKRQRLSRQQWRSQKDAAKAAQAALERVDGAEIRIVEIERRGEEVQTTIDELKEMHTDLKVQVDGIVAREEAVSDRETAVMDREVAITDKEADVVRLIEAAHEEADEIVGKAQQERRLIRGFVVKLRDVVTRIGSAFGLEFLGKDLTDDLSKIEDALAAAEQSGPEADGDDGLSM